MALQDNSYNNNRKKYSQFFESRFTGFLSTRNSIRWRLFSHFFFKWMIFLSHLSVNANRFILKTRFFFLYESWLLAVSWWRINLFRYNLLWARFCEVQWNFSHEWFTFHKRKSCEKLQKQFFSNSTQKFLRCCVAESAEPRDDYEPTLLIILLCN